MPKSSKKKKEKTADFTRAKFKLGKGKQVANNAIDTSFKARSIAIPQQTIGQEKDASKPVTRRNLTLEEVLQHLKHYNPNTRKDAIAGLRELLEGYPHLVEASLSSVIQTCARLIGDEDAEVRKTLISFFSWFLRASPLHNLRPHIPMLLLFVTSAQTNIFPAIRIDAVRVLDLLLDLTPDLVVQNWTEPDNTGSRVLEGYLGLLSAGSNYWKGSKDDGPVVTASSVTLSTNSRLAVLSSLAKFVSAAVTGSSTRDERLIPLWYMANSFSSDPEFRSFVSLIQSSLTTKADKSYDEVEWASEANQNAIETFVGNFNSAFPPMAGSSDYSIGGLGDIGQSLAALQPNEKHSQHAKSEFNVRAIHIAHLARTLNPIMVSTWLDVAPTLFGVTASTSRFETEAKLAQAVMQIIASLYGAIFRNPELPTEALSHSLDNLGILLSYMSPYLPSASESSDVQHEDFSRDLSFSYCELTSLAALGSQSISGSTSKQQAPTKLKQLKALSTQLERVGEYVTSALNGELKSSTHPMGYPLTASAYSSLLPTIWLLMDTRSSENDLGISAGIRLTCIKHAVYVPSKAAAKAMATQFVGSLLILYGSRGNPSAHRIVLSQAEVEAFREWYQQLPKVLWEIGASDLPLTETILRLLLRLNQLGTAIVDINTNIAVSSRFAPFFSTSRPDRGTLPGPFAKLRDFSTVRRLSLDVAFVLTRMRHSSAESLRIAVQTAVKDSPEALYWISLLSR